MGSVSYPLGGQMLKYEEQYLDLCEKILDHGEWVNNERTGKKCKTIINHDFIYNVGKEDVPLLTTKQVFVTSAIAEIIGYLRGYTNAEDFAKIGSSSWRANANKTKSWVENPNRKGEGDCGIIYGAVARDWHGIDLIDKVYKNLKQGVDDRREIITFYDPSKFDKACLRPCAFQWQFSLVNGKLSLHVYQASCDAPLGLPWNSVSFYWLLKTMAKITGNVPDKVYHKIVNIHIYEDQIEAIRYQLSKRKESLDIKPLLEVPSWVCSMEDLLKEDLHAKSYFKLTNYKHLGKIEFPFSE